MSILVDRNTRVICQGLGKAGTFHAVQCREYGTQVVGGITPGKGGTVKEGFPLFNTVAEAVAKTGANASHDLRARRRPRPTRSWRRPTPASRSSSPSPRAFPSSTWPGSCGSWPRSPACRLVGPNCPGVITPGQCKIGIMPGYIHKPGPVGVISRSGTLTYEAVWQLTALGLGQSTCVGIGGDPIIGTNQIDLLKLFQDDPQTEAILMIGEIGGTAEERAAEYISQERDQAGRRVHRRADGPAGQADGPRRGHHLRRQRRRPRTRSRR